MKDESGVRATWNEFRLEILVFAAVIVVMVSVGLALTTHDRPYSQRWIEYKSTLVNACLNDGHYTRGECITLAGDK